MSLRDLLLRMDRLVGDDKPRERSHVRFLIPSNGRGAGAPSGHRVGDPEVHQYDAFTGVCEFPACAELHGARSDVRLGEPSGEADDVGDAPPADAVEDEG